MANRLYRSRAVAQSRVLAKSAARDGVIGAGLALMLLTGLIASNLDVRQMMSESGELQSLLATIVLVIVVQCGIAAGLCGFAIRKAWSPN